MRVDNAGVSLNIDVDGPEGAPAVLLLRGISSSAATDRYLVPQLAGRYRLDRLDFRATAARTALPANTAS